jgi:hypothetical protein
MRGSMRTAPRMKVIPVHSRLDNEVRLGALRGGGLDSNAARR